MPRWLAARAPQLVSSVELNSASPSALQKFHNGCHCESSTELTALEKAAQLLLEKLKTSTASFHHWSTIHWVGLAWAAAKRATESFIFFKLSSWGTNFIPPM